MVCTSGPELEASGSCCSVEQLEVQLCSLLSCCMGPSTTSAWRSGQVQPALRLLPCEDPGLQSICSREAAVDVLKVGTEFWPSALVPEACLGQRRRGKRTTLPAVSRLLLEPVKKGCW